MWDLESHIPEKPREPNGDYEDFLVEHFSSDEITLLKENIKYGTLWDILKIIFDIDNKFDEIFELRNEKNPSVATILKYQAQLTYLSDLNISLRQQQHFLGVLASSGLLSEAQHTLYTQKITQLADRYQKESRYAEGFVKFTLRDIWPDLSPRLDVDIDVDGSKDKSIWRYSYRLYIGLPEDSDAKNDDQQIEYLRKLYASENIIRELVHTKRWTDEIDKALYDLKRNEAVRILNDLAEESAKKNIDLSPKIKEEFSRQNIIIYQLDNKKKTFRI